MNWNSNSSLIGGYQSFVLHLMKYISIVMVVVGLLIFMLTVLDLIFFHVWGYTWQTLIFELLFIGFSLAGFRFVSWRLKSLKKLKLGK